MFDPFMAEEIARMARDEALAYAARRRLVAEARLAARIADGRRKRSLAGRHDPALGARLVGQVYAIRTWLAGALRALAARLESPRTPASSQPLAALHQAGWSVPR